MLFRIRPEQCSGSLAVCGAGTACSSEANQFLKVSVAESVSTHVCTLVRRGPDIHKAFLLIECAFICWRLPIRVSSGTSDGAGAFPCGNEIPDRGRVIALSGHPSCNHYRDWERPLPEWSSVSDAELDWALVRCLPSGAFAQRPTTGRQCTCPSSGPGFPGLWSIDPWFGHPFWGTHSGAPIRKYCERRARIT